MGANAIRHRRTVSGHRSRPRNDRFRGRLPQSRRDRRGFRQERPDPGDAGRPRVRSRRDRGRHRRRTDWQPASATVQTPRKQSDHQPDGVQQRGRGRRRPATRWHEPDGPDRGKHRQNEDDPTLGGRR